MPIFASNFASNSLSGTVRVVNGFANINLNTIPYALEGDKSFVIKIRKDSTTGEVLSTTPTLTFRDSSSLVSVTANVSSVAEGNLVAFSVVTANTIDGAKLFYSVLPVTANVTADDFYANIGVVTITNNAGLFVLRANTNIAPMDETGETFKIQIRTADNIGNIVFTTSNVAILDTDKTYNTLGLIPSSSSVSETANVTFTYTATNIPAGTILYYNTTGNLTSFVSNTGSFVMNSTSNTFVIATGTVSFNAIRSFNVVLRTGSNQGAVFATSNNITVSSTSLVPMSATGGVQSNVGGYRIHTFTSPGTITFNKSGDIEYLLAGGGGGGQGVGGGGGAGGLLLSGYNGATKFSATTGTPYSITLGVGAGTNTRGSNTTAFGLTAYGGGAGGAGGGGSGGGNYGKGVYSGSPFVSSPVRQGYDGGNLGGGGAGGSAPSTADFPTPGGAGYDSSFTGSPYTYCAGGAGTPGGSSFSGVPGPSQTNSGGYGAGGDGRYQNGAGNSGPGFAAVRYYLNAPVFVSIDAPGPFVFEGANIFLTLNTISIQNNTLFYYSTVGNVVSSDFISGNTGSFRTTFDATVITLQSNTNIPTNEERSFQLKIASEPGLSADALFTGNVFTIKDIGLQARASAIQYLVAAGGGGGGTDPGADAYYGAGGGAGGLLSNIMAVTPGTSYTITIGAGGGAGTNKGSNSSIGTSVITIGGGYGSTWPATPGGPGGSGGGGARGGAPGVPTTLTLGAGTPGQGYPGMALLDGNSGGGAGGSAGVPGTFGRSGGPGISSSISGTAMYYAGGGGGGFAATASPPDGSVGNNVAGAPNTGGGGGRGQAAGSGIVIVRFPDIFAIANATTGSPNVIYANANIIYRFWQSGTITF
jgi:hypothetical protein